MFKTRMLQCPGMRRKEGARGYPKYRKGIFLCVEFSASGHLAKELGNMDISIACCGTN